MKYLISYTVISVLILQSVGNTFFLLDYQLSLERYKASCENTQKPELKCQGKCQMMKQTQKFGFSEKDNDNNPKTPSLKSVKQFDIYNHSEITGSSPTYSLLEEKKFIFDSNYSFYVSSLSPPPPELG